MQLRHLAIAVALLGALGCVGTVTGGDDERRLDGADGGAPGGCATCDGGGGGGDGGGGGEPPLPAVPAQVIDVLDETPYVEGSCTPATSPGWPHEAQTCSYSAGGVAAVVTTATPSPERVGAWIVDASQEIPALWELRDTDPAAYAEGLSKIAWAVMIQSGRIYPLEGDVVENLGDGYFPYHFLDGVTTTCGSGCYCRINSLHRTEWCAWQDHVGASSYDDCIAQVGASSYTDAWGGQCLGNHAAAWLSARNEHFRARAYRYQQSMAGSCPAAGSCAPADVLAALDAATQ